MSLITDDNRRWWTLAAVTSCLFMVMLDTTIVNVALPTIQADLGIKLSELEWTVNAYLLAEAAFLLPCGKLADFLGRRRILLVGLALFTVSSLAAGLATTGGMLIAARAAQGFGAALMMPATHSIISANFEERDHGLAYGIWAGVSTLGLALGPLAGGLLVQKIDWSWIFFVNVPVGVVALVAVRFVIRESRDTSTDQGLDPAGLLVSAASLFALVFALTEGQRYGWGSHTILILFAGAAIGFVVFVALEAWQRRPMLDLSLFRNSTFTGANLGVMFVMLAMLGVLFFASIYVQVVLGFSVIQTGAIFLPMTLVLLLAAPVAGLLGDRIGYRWPVAAGMMLLAAGLALFSRLGVHATFWDMLPALIIGGAGLGIANAPLTAAAMAATPLEKAGVGAGVMTSFRQTGGALGVAIMGAIVTAKIGDIPPVSPRFAGAFVDGFQEALRAGAGIALVGALITFATIRKVRAVEPVPVPIPAAAERPSFVGRLAAVGLGPAAPRPTALRPIVRPGVVHVADTSAWPDAPALIVRNGALAGLRIPVHGELLLGREAADITIDDPMVSRRHAVARPVDGTLEVTDLDSVNGTFVNGARLERPRRLADRDLISLGQTTLLVDVPAPPPRAAPTVPAYLPAASPPVLVVEDGALAGGRFPVERELSLGREDADVTIDDPKVSRRHALARPVDGTVEIADAGSVNGTFVNDERIAEPRRLEDGDMIRLGETTLRAEVPAPPPLAAANVAARPLAAIAPPTLVVQDGPLAGRRFPVEWEVSIGREDADITLDDPRVSRRHALARPVDGGLELSDTGSANGTFVNGERIESPRRLVDGDVIRFGETSLHAEVAAADPGRTAEAPISPAEQTTRR